MQDLEKYSMQLKKIMLYILKKNPNQTGLTEIGDLLKNTKEALSKPIGVLGIKIEKEKSLAVKAREIVQNNM